MKTYDPKQVVIIVGGRQITGFADGTFLTVAREAEAFTMQVGADGEAARSKSNNKSGKFEMDLLQTSEGNKILSDLALADEANNSGLVPVLVKDNSGASLHAAEQAYIEKTADSEYSKEAGPRKWVLRTDVLLTYPAGN